MSEVQATKVCTKCKVEKAMTEFHRSLRDGYRSVCRPCRSIESEHIRATEEYQTKRRAYNKVYIQRPDVKERRAEYQRAKPEIGKTSKQRWRKSQKGKDTTRRYEQSRVAQRRACSAVSHAIKVHALPAVTSMKCVRCLGGSEHYHHWSYDPRFRLSVIPLCFDCHWFVHHD